MAETQNNTTTNPEVVKTPEVVKVRKHKVFGEYKKCKVSYKQPGQDKVSIFISVNAYNLECQQDTEVEIPEQIIDILKAATYTTYNFNEKTQSHESAEAKKYFVELV